jgi:hypothetical protein
VVCFGGAALSVTGNTKQLYQLVAGFLLIKNPSAAPNATPAPTPMGSACMATPTALPMAIPIAIPTPNLFFIFRSLPLDQIPNNHLQRPGIHN